MSQQMNLQKGLVGHWTMDDADISGGVLYDSAAVDQTNATINGGITVGNSGSPIGQHTESDATSNAYIGTRYLLTSTITTGYSTAFWVKDIGASGSGGNRFLSMDVSDWWGVTRNGSAGTAEFHMRGSDGSQHHITDNNFGTGTWVHYSMVWDNTNTEMRVYKNGSLWNTKSTSTSGFGSGSVNRYLILHDGSESASYNTNQQVPVDCGLSDVRVWHRPITEGEINKLYQMRQQRHYYL